jgi:GNAT superfamily N-acetyltransferase
VFGESNSVSPFVRDAAVEDARSIAQIHVDAWRAAYTGLLPDRILAGLSVAGRETQWRARLSPASRGPRTLVAEDAAGLRGFVTYLVPSRDEDEGPDVGEIPALYVGPESWRAGAGGALIATAEGRMRQEGCSEAILWMLAGNTARAFYESRGWVDDGGRRPSQYFPAEARLEEVRFRKPL